MKTILVIDDNETYHDILSNLLSNAGYHVAHAHNGSTGLEMAQRQPVDCILLDLHMPVVSGFSVMQQLSANDRTRGIPLIVMSAHFSPTEVAALIPTKYLIAKHELPRRIVSLVDQAFANSSLTI